eukprot:CAMPEP_0181293578 /NCGR_PEP_ID=MMETSP1101-20121128/3139_1 /TAXON_ID=46948 /ORGANISM="Rhodomonas abbreviata, Strain Caron Lab Isolate" /LENGTH=134 /DNA_ID=CAMNT_0023398173 /DNA_START=726 /DNA_END=1130 /DNA_ORIENTATION=+
MAVLFLGSKCLTSSCISTTTRTAFIMDRYSFTSSLLCAEDLDAGREPASGDDSREEAAQRVSLPENRLPMNDFRLPRFPPDDESGSSDILRTRPWGGPRDDASGSSDFLRSRPVPVSSKMSEHDELFFLVICGR